IPRRQSEANFRFTRAVADFPLVGSVAPRRAARGEQQPRVGSAAPPRVAAAPAPAKSARPSVLEAVSGAPIPDSLVEHFRRQRLALRPAPPDPTAPPLR